MSSVATGERDSSDMTSVTKEKNSSEEIAIEPREFRNALGRFATGICIVTTRDSNDEPLGITINSFSSVSLDPPLILFSLARTCFGLEGWLAAKHYSVNVLTADQKSLSDRFARPRTDKWAGVELEEGIAGIPLLPDSLARFQCRSEHHYDGGDHVILVGRVLAFDAPSAGVEPLTYFAGHYHRLAGETAGTMTPEDLWPHGW
jgi:3-hydroxy-9,10-secoandrosta-1,3,5(10)-triene-9,17-dione monooxygenase reductase component